jgi:hypothetical protein
MKGAERDRQKRDGPAKARPRSRARGQAVIFFVMTLVIMVFLVLWNYDLHKILFVKSLTQNAGDAAAIMGARWQGISLNMIGDLNLLQALALAVEEDDEVASSINRIQARLCYAGPLIAFNAAQQAAKNNRAHRNADFDRLMREHARMVREDYLHVTGADGEILFPEPYPGAWSEYASMLELAANDGVAAGPDNVRFYGDAMGGHLLLRVDFYEAIAGRNWCWFFHNAPDLLEEYDNYLWWPALPEPPRMQYINSEIFGLGLVRRTTTLDGMSDGENFDEWLDEMARERDLTGTINTNALYRSATWYLYDSSVWTSWSAMETDGEDPFPATGFVRPQYDYAGADVAVRIAEATTRVSPASGGGGAQTNVISWTAAAKSFGFLNEADRPDAFGLVLPAFREVRLIPVDASSAPSGGGYNIEWREHVEQHLPIYMQTGPSPAACWYCRQLQTWERPEFRMAGSEWLFWNSDRCTVVPSGPGGRGGGRRIAH